MFNATMPVMPVLTAGEQDVSLDVVDLRAFYASPLGHVARRFVGDAALRFWPDVRGLRVAGIGFAVPYLALLREGTERTLALMPATQGVVNWPSAGLSASVLVEPTALPLPDASIDRIMVIHALEESESPEELLEEVWRVLGPGGRVLAVVPSRRGLWARMDTTPFGHGRSYSRNQLEGLMRRTMLSPENWSEALYVPPLPRRFLMQSAAIWEKAGRGLSLPLAGVHVVDATKQFYRKAPLRASRRSFAFRQLLLPAPAPTTRHGEEPPTGGVPG
jgi:SAM-dependent methyltransferase